MSEERPQELFERYLTDEISDDEKTELTRLLDEDPSHRVQFREFIELEYSLDAHLSSESDEEGEVVSFKRAKFAIARSRNWEHLGVAALLLLSLTLGWMLWSKDSSPSVPERNELGSVAKLAGISDDAVFADGHGLSTSPGSFLSKGWIILDRGSVDIEFHCGAMVELTGPAVFGIDSALRGGGIRRSEGACSGRSVGICDRDRKYGSGRSGNTL